MNEPRPLVLRGLGYVDEWTLAPAVYKAGWLDNQRFIAVLSDGIFYGYLPTMQYQHSFGYVYSPEPGYDFVIADTGDIAVLVDDFTISVNHVQMTLGLDAPIQEFRWLPSLFWQ
jgi:hypothetical protein